MTRFLNVPLDVSDIVLMTFMILLDSYMKPTRVGSDYIYIRMPRTHVIVPSAHQRIGAQCMPISITIVLAYNVYAYIFVYKTITVSEINCFGQ